MHYMYVLRLIVVSHNAKDCRINALAITKCDYHKDTYVLCIILSDAYLTLKGNRSQLFKIDVLKIH